MNRFSKSATAWRYAGVHCCMQKVRMLHIIIRPERGRGELRMCTQILRLYVYQATTVRLQYTFLAYSQWYGIHIRIHESTTRTRSDVGTQTAVAGIKGALSVGGAQPPAQATLGQTHTMTQTCSAPVTVHQYHVPYRCIPGPTRRRPGQTRTDGCGFIPASRGSNPTAAIDRSITCSGTLCSVLRRALCMHPQSVG